jgi:predicted DNA-binding transcriptional regulator AlpA
MRNTPSTRGGARVPRRSGVAGPFGVPRLEELLADPDQVRVLDAHTTRALKTQAISALILLQSHDLDTARAQTDIHERRRSDRLLDVSQAAEKLCVKRDWLYRHHSDLPFRVRHGKLLRFSELGIEDYIRKRRG